MYTRFICLTLSFTALFTSLGLGIEYLYSPRPLLIAEAHAKSNTAPSTVIQPLMQVLVTGAVKKPGLYELPRGARLAALIQRAEGLTPAADLTPAQLQRRLAVGEVVHVPAKSVKNAPSNAADKSSPVAKRVHIQSAGLNELTQLAGIGPALAKRILDYRQGHPFQRIEDLQKVKGIGPKTFAKMKSQLAL